MIIQATKKLQDLLGIKIEEVPNCKEPSVNLWHGNIFKIGRKNCLLVTHNDSYYSVFIYGVTKANMKNIDKTIGDYLQKLMYRDGFRLSEIKYMVKSIDRISYAKTSNRKVMGVMNDMIHMLKYFNMTEHELELASRLNQTPYKSKDFYFPLEALKDVLSRENTL